MSIKAFAVCISVASILCGCQSNEARVREAYSKTCTMAGDYAYLVRESKNSMTLEQQVDRLPDDDDPSTSALFRAVAMVYEGHSAYETSETVREYCLSRYVEINK